MEPSFPWLQYLVTNTRESVPAQPSLLVASGDCFRFPETDSSSVKQWQFALGGVVCTRDEVLYMSMLILEVARSALKEWPSCSLYSGWHWARMSLWSHRSTYVLCVCVFTRCLWGCVCYVCVHQGWICANRTAWACLGACLHMAECASVFPALLGESCNYALWQRQRQGSPSH